MEDTKSGRGPNFWRNLVAYWILGLTNNYGYVVMLSAAHDIIADIAAEEFKINLSENEVPRACQYLSTGTILLADIIPALLIKMVLPFVCFWVHVRVLSAILLTIFSFFLVAFAKVKWMAFLGVALTSLSSGLGETTFLAYSSKFNINVLSAWSSGTGGAGVIGSLSYAAMRDIGLSSQSTLLIMLIVPVLESVAFWLILGKPAAEKDVEINTSAKSKTDESDSHGQSLTFREKLLYIPRLFVYMIPLSLVYLFEYFINQGLFELIYFRGIFMKIASQYRWFSFDYQVGVFISRSSVNVIHIRRIWIMALLQFVNLVIFLHEAIFFFMPYLWTTFLLIFWEGLLGGGAYVNTYYRIPQEIPQSHLIFAMSFVSLSDTVAIMIAGFIAIPVHNVICKLPEPKRV